MNVKEKILLIIEDESRPYKIMDGQQGICVGDALVNTRIGPEKAQYDLFFTDKRIILAIVLSTSDLSDCLEFAGLNLMLKGKKIKEENRLQFGDKSPKEILLIHKDNFDIPYDKIKVIKLRKGFTGSKLYIEFSNNDQRKNIKLPIPKKRVEEVDLFIKHYLL
jgi:hypothetical protein